MTYGKPNEEIHMQGQTAGGFDMKKFIIKDKQVTKKDRINIGKLIDKQHAEVR